MAANETAALVVALSAQVSKFQKDMDQANGIADKSVKQIENRFAAANGAIGKQMSNFASTASSQLGSVGSVLTALGPIGLGVAATIGTLALAFAFVSEKVDAFAEKAKRLKDAAETAGLTITQFRLLGQAGTKVGIDSEQTEAFINRLTVSLDELRTKSSGPLFDALLRIDAGLVREVASAKDTAEAIDILSRAFAKLTDQQQKNALVAAIGGKRNLAGGRLLDFVAENDGLKGLEKSAEDAGNQINESLIKRIAQLKREIEEIKKRTDNIWGRTFSEEVLAEQKASAEFWLKIAQAVERVQGALSNLPSFSLPTPGGTEGGFLGRLIKLLGDKAQDAGQAPIALSRVRAAVGLSAEPATPTPAAVPLPTPRPAGATTADPRAIRATDLELMRKWTSLLGDAITPAEALKQKILELAVAQDRGGVSDTIRARALAAFKLAQEQTAVSTRERLGIATQEEISAVRLRDLEAQRAKGYVTNSEEMAAAERIVAREAKLTAEALQVRSANLPQLKQFELDAANLSKQLDTLALTSVNNLGTALGDIASGTVTAADGFRELGLQVVRSVTDMIIRMTILVPIAKALQSSLGGFLPGGIGTATADNPFPNYPRNAGGTDNWGGGLTWVGERGPELLNLPRGSQITPANLVGRGGSGGDINVTLKMDLAGVNGDETIRRMVVAGSRQAVKEALVQANAAAPSRQQRYAMLGT